jgi:hypothetical protein
MNIADGKRMSRMQVTANDKLSLNTSQRAASARASPVRLSVATGILKSTVLRACGGGLIPPAAS